MARTYSKHDERREHILDGAWEMFRERGFEATTIAMVIERLEISKGAFYHYFASKADVLDAITDRLSSDSLADMQHIARDPSLNANDKFNRFLESARQWRVRHMDSVIDTARVLYRDENLVIRQKMLMRLQAVATPLLCDILDQAVDEGVFQISNSREAALLLWQISNAFADSQMNTLLAENSIEAKANELAERAEFVIESLERILGAPQGLITRPDHRFFTSFARAAAEKAHEVA